MSRTEAVQFGRASVPAAADAQARAEDGRVRRQPWLGYAAAVMLVAAATVLAFVAENVVAGPNLTLVFVLPVVICAAAFGWGPAFAAVIAGALCYDFFFTQPRYSFAIAGPSDIWATALLFVVAAIVSSVAAQARQRTLEARLAADQAEALQSVAQLVVARRPRAQITAEAARALNRMFRAPAVIVVRTSSGVSVAASAGHVELSGADEKAALWAIETQTHSRADAYPHDQSDFDFWPIATPQSCDAAIGVNFGHSDDGRPPQPERLIDAMTAYLATSRAPGSPKPLR